MPHNSHTVARLYFFGCCAKNVSGKTRSQISVDVNMPDTDILSSHKLCDWVEKILPSAFGTMIKQKNDKKKKESLKKKNQQNTAWEHWEKPWAECVIMVDVIRTTVQCVAQARARLERCRNSLQKWLCLLSVSPFLATKKTGDLRMELRPKVSKRTSSPCSH